MFVWPGAVPHTVKMTLIVSPGPYTVVSAGPGLAYVLLADTQVLTECRLGFWAYTGSHNTLLISLSVG